VGREALRLGYLVGDWPVLSETFLAREVEALPRCGVEPVIFSLAALQPAPPPLTPGLIRVLTVARRRPAWLRWLPAAAGLALHAAWSNLPAQVAWMARQLGGPPYTVAGHARDVFGPPEAAAEALAEARGLSACNRAAWRALAGRCGACRVACLPHGLPLAQWPFQPLEGRQPIILGIGRLVPKKGFDTLVRTVFGSQALVILGDGPERDPLAALAAAVSQDEVRAWLGRAAVLVLPSRVTPDGDRDGLANVLLEAAATGAPLVTTPAGAATDLVRHGVSGLLAPPDDPAALGAAIARVLNEPGLARRLAAGARAAVEQCYDLEVNTARLARWLRAQHRPESVDGGRVQQ